MLFFYLALSSVAFAAEIDEATKKICNQVMISIYQEILSVKDRYPELSDFDENSFYENSRGVYAVIYEQKNRPGGKGAPLFGFGLTIDILDADNFPGKVGKFGFSFPLLGVKFSGYQPEYIKRGQFNLRTVINRAGVTLSEHEQSFLPLGLEIKPRKAVFAVSELIEFDVILTNRGSTNIFVKKLDFNTLYIVTNDKPWGTPPSHKAPSGQWVTLLRGDSIQGHFQSESLSHPGEVRISAAYRMVVKGINPSANITVKVE